MNLTLRARIFIIISLAVLIILAISITLAVISKKNQAVENAIVENQTNTDLMQSDEITVIPGIQPTVVNSDLPIKQQTTEEKMRSAAENIAKIFTERYGSYSTDNPGQNLKDLESLSTPDLWTVLKGKIETMTVGKEFISMTTRAFSASIISFETDKAIVKTVSTKEENKSGVLREFNQEAEVTLLRNGDNWLVDDLKWK